MSAWVDAWLQAAERRVPGPHFNSECFSLRAEVEASLGYALTYELQLDPEESEADFASRVLAQLQDHLESKRQSRDGPPGLLVWLWHEANAYLYRGPDFVQRLMMARPSAAVALLPGPAST